MSYPSISTFNNVAHTKSEDTIPIDQFLVGIKNGKWQDFVIPIWNIEDPAMRREAKKSVPAVTISGIFPDRQDKNMVKHSGLIAIDIDHISNLNDTKDKLAMDPYVYAVFRSVSGRGLCAIFKINGAKHRDSFSAIGEYLFTHYHLVIDSTCINPSRIRFVSYDPEIYVNESAIKWTKVPEIKAPKKIERIIFVQNDFDNLVNEITDKRLNLCENYYEWLRIGFGLADKFGEYGRDYFHRFSQISFKYDSQMADKQYNACLRDGGASKCTIATVYHYMKQAGLELYSERTKTIANLAISQKRGGVPSAAQTVESLKNHANIEGDDVLKIVEQVRNQDIELREDSDQEIFEQWLRVTHDLKYDEVSRFIYIDGKLTSERLLNDLFREAKKSFSKMSYDLMVKTIRSSISVPFNPLKNFIENNIERGKVKRGLDGEWQSPVLDKYFGSINTHDTEYVKYFGKKWFVGMISHIYGKVSPLFLVLAGIKQNTGKTTMIRQMLPEELRSYMAKSNLSAGKDDQILMTQKLLIYDDELDGEAKDNRKIKGTTSSDEFTLRVPYGADNITIIRMAALAGTSNVTNLLNDPTGENRRFIIAEVDSIDFEQINSVDRTELFMEAYHLFKNGYPFELNADDIRYLNKYQNKYQESVLEGEMLLQLFDPSGDTPMTAAQIANKIKFYSNFNINFKTVVSELKRHGFTEVQRVISGRQIKCWLVREKSDLEIHMEQSQEPLEPVPFPKYEPEQVKLENQTPTEPVKYIPPSPPQFSFDDFFKKQ